MYAGCDNRVASFNGTAGSLDEGRRLPILNDGDRFQRYFAVRGNLPNTSSLVANVERGERDGQRIGINGTGKYDIGGHA